MPESMSGPTTDSSDIVVPRTSLVAVVSLRHQRVITGNGMVISSLVRMVSMMMTRESGLLTAALAFRKIRHAMLFVIKILKVANRARGPASYVRANGYRA